MSGKLTYRDWLVEQTIDAFEATHPDYTRENGRVVLAETLEELAEQVDAWIAEYE